MTNSIKKIKSNWQIIVYLALIFGALTFLFATLIAPKYRSDVKILIIQNQSDAFSASKSVNYLSDVFLEVAHSETFMADALTAPFGIEKKFSEDAKKRKKQWKDAVKIKKIDNTGIVEISVFEESRKEAEKIAGAIGWNFLNNGSKYYGDNKSVQIKIIDGPITSANPTYPNVILAAALGILAGSFLGFILVIFYDFSVTKRDAKKGSSREMISKQIKRQLEERKNKKELTYEDPTVDFYKVHAKSEVAIEKQPEKIEAPSGNEENLSVTEKRAGKVTEKRTEKNENQQEKFSKKKFLSNLYQKSIFAGTKSAETEKKISDTGKSVQERIDKMTDPIEQVKKISTSGPQKSDEYQMWRPGGLKVPAPDNLPIFMEDEETISQSGKSSKLSESPQSSKEQVFQEDEFSNELAISKQEQKSENEKKVDEVEGAHPENFAIETVYEKEPTDEEVKQRLNKLLKGEL